ncbi:MAG: NRDE family protein [Methanobacteriota archaeon]|nr:MAG: NRDE family protein [Euryarchaeota archaeon]
MCTLIAWFHTVPGYDLIIGMNRDEDRTRPAEPPRALPGPPPFVAPRDARAGGTWLGVNQLGLIAALSNRRGKASTTAKSRGLLMLEVLKAAHPRAAEIAIEREVSASEYNFFNLFAATRQELRFFAYEGQLRMSRGREGLNVLTNNGGNVDGDEKVATIRALAGSAEFPSGEKAIGWLESTLRHHGGSATVPLCVHFPGGGTVSSTILALHNADPGQHILLYANGSPCENPYRDYSALVRQLNPGAP